MAKQKSVALPPSGVKSDITGKPKVKTKAGCRTQIAAGIVFLCGLSFLVSLLPKTPEQLAATQTAAVVALAASNVPALATNIPSTATSIPSTSAPTETLVSVVVVALPSATNTVTPYPDITMTPTTPATFAEEESSVKKLPGVKTVERIERHGTDYWAIVTTWPKFNTESFAGLIEIQAIKVDLYTFRFAVRIDDGESSPLWWAEENATWSSSSAPPAWVDLGVTSAPTSLPSTALPATPIPAVVAVPNQPASTVAPTTNTVQSVEGKTYYAGSDGANVRTCTTTKCDVLTKIAAGEPIVVDGTVTGDAASAGNTLWYRVQYQGQIAYVYSGVVALTKPTTVSNTAGNSNTGSNTSNQQSSSNSSVAPVPQSVRADAAAVCSTFDYSVCSKYQRPANCNEVVAQGIPSRDAACCFPARDGDKDGDACYGG